MSLLLHIAVLQLSLLSLGYGQDSSPGIHRIADPFLRGGFNPFETGGGGGGGDCAEAVKKNSKDNNGYNDGGPVEKKDKLKFDAGNAGKACWKNSDQNSGDVNFATVDGGKLKGCPFANKLNGKNLVAYSPKGGGKSAMFHSCSILCSDGDVKVKVDGSAKDAKLKVCTADSFTDSKPKNCKPVKFGQPVKVASGKNSIYDIVLVAENFKKDGYVAIKKIDADFKPCDDSGGPAGDDALCAAACDFEGQTTCSYARDPANQAATEFKAYETKTIVGNLDSGVNARLDGNPTAAYPIVADSGFMGTPQNPGDLNVASVDVPEVADDEHEMTVDVYEACDGDAAKVCFDSISNCPADFFNLGVTAADRQWQKKKVKVPKGTKKIFLVGDNSAGQRFCAVGFNDVNFVKAGSDTPLCGGDAKEEKPQN